MTMKSTAVRVVGAGVMHVAQSSKKQTTTSQTHSGNVILLGNDKPYWMTSRSVANNKTVGELLGDLFKHGYKPGTIVIRRSDLKPSDLYIDTGDMGMITRLNPLIAGKEGIYAPLRVSWMTGKSDDWWPMDLVVLSTIKDLSSIKKEAGIV